MKTSFELNPVTEGKQATFLSFMMENSYLLPKIYDNLEALKGKIWFYTLDLLADSDAQMW